MPFAPMSNAERQRRFRARNPGYWRKYYARERAGRIAAQKKVAALMRELAKARYAAAQEQPTTPLVFKTPLMLPAPVQDPTMAALEALAASLASKSTREALHVLTPATRTTDPRAA